MGCRGILSDGGVGIPCSCIYSVHLIILTDPCMMENYELLLSGAEAETQQGLFRAHVFPEVPPHLKY